MADMMPSEPQHASEYDDRTAAAVKSVLVEIGQILGSFKGRFAVIGGAVPWLLLDNEEMPHVGTLDLDLSLDAAALGDGEYAHLIEALLAHGYTQNEQLKKFQLVRQIQPDDDGPSINVVIDFLMPKNAAILRNVPPLIDNFAVQRADGADLAISHHQMVAVSGTMPGGVKNTIEVAVCTIPALLAMKGHAINNRYKQKDAYDIYYCVRNYFGGPEALAKDCIPLLEQASGKSGYEYINAKFDVVDGFGPTCTRNFVVETSLAGDLTPDQVQQDAFGQVDAWLRALGLRA